MIPTKINLVITKSSFNLLSPELKKVIIDIAKDLKPALDDIHNKPPYLLPSEVKLLKWNENDVYTLTPVKITKEKYNLILGRG